MFENLSDKLERAFSLLKGHGRITEINVAQTLKEVRRALIDADVSYRTAKKFVSDVKEKALGQQVLTSINPGQLMVKIVQDELTKLMGSSAQEINISSSLTIILISGLQGSGKTTFSGKLANYLVQKKQLKPLLVACDVYRPAAIDQLEVVASQISVPVFKDLDTKNPVEIAKKGIEIAKSQGKNVVIIDTAGRLAVDNEMMAEIRSIKDAVTPSEILFVVDAMTGQDAVNTAKTFNEVLDFDGVVLTKLDGDTRGGAALTIKNEVNKPIKFIGTGEKMDAIDIFYPNRMADRILGMGDVVSLVEKAQEQFSEKEARDMERKLLKNQFTFNDFLKQIKQIKKMGNIKDLLGMVPGVGKAIRNLDIDDDAFNSIENIIFSMTEQERNNPKIINHSRRQRIANGSGSKIEDVNKLIKQFSQMGKMMKMMKSGGFENMMKNFNGPNPNFK
ncbi:MAG: signal recognition particle protein [Flavobacteriales bacterium]|jgi:signal recognition particle subunit SRP54|nr:signal recognition particle protein [Flavobacteriales bacterium]|tara:strand:+ start:3718 stop:5058 length:1341 start_codon:yes stop_codon:yes gene_type:complete